MPPAEGTITCHAFDGGLTEMQGVAWFGFLQTYATVTRAVESGLLRSHDLSFSALEILMRLDHAEAPEPVRRLAARVISVSPTRVSRVVADLAQRGLLHRQSSPDDHRLALVSITVEGRRRLAEAGATFQQLVSEHFLGSLGDDDIAALARVWRLLGSDRACAATREPVEASPAG